MTGAMAAKIIYLLNWKTMMMELILSRIENIMKSKVMQKT